MQNRPRNFRGQGVRSKECCDFVIHMIFPIDLDRKPLLALLRVFRQCPDREPEAAALPVLLAVDINDPVKSDRPNAKNANSNCDRVTNRDRRVRGYCFHPPNIELTPISECFLRSVEDFLPPSQSNSMVVVFITTGEFTEARPHIGIVKRRPRLLGNFLQKLLMGWLGQTEQWDLGNNTCCNVHCE